MPIRWDDINPIFLDFETQSAADIKELGGRLYVGHESTRLLSAVFLVDGVYHVWVPVEGAPEVDPAELWPEQLGERRPVEVHYGPLCPAVVGDAVEAGRTFVAHNALGFDRYVWERFVAATSPPWADTVPLARSAGYPGGLDKLAKLFGFPGKDAGKRFLRDLTTAKYVDGEVRYPTLVPGKLAAVLRYNVADVALLAAMWERLSDVAVEADVIEAHDAVNERGVRLDVSLARKLQAVAGESVSRAAERVAELTGGALNAGNIRSVKQVNDWLASKGVRVRDYSGKNTLRKDFVEQALANPWMMLDEDSPVAAVEDIDPAVFEVLRLRAAALRITGAKAERAVARAGRDGRARDLHSYWTAHTGRWSSSGIQIHNMPRPKKGVPVERLLALHESGEWGDDAATSFDLIASTLPPGKLTVDDAISGLIRPCFIPDPGNCFLIVDYAAIECRCVAWMAGEEGLLATLAAGGDVYREFATRIFGKPEPEVNDYERQIAKICILGLGYGMSVEKFRIYCGLQQIDLAAAGTTAEKCVDTYRATYPAIAGEYAGMIDGRPYRRGGLWDRFGRAAMNAVAEGGVHHAGRCSFSRGSGGLVCTLPSGRQLRYRNARIEDTIPSYYRHLGIPGKMRPTLVYDGERGPTSLYGAKGVENGSQAICRDVLAAAVVNLDRAPLNPVMHVHDEAVCERPLASRDADLNRMAGIMATVPDWAPGFPISVAGFAAPRYLKAAPHGWPEVKRSAGA